jgi:hypothetical protein
MVLPVVGLASLVIGIVLGVVYRRPQLFLFLIPFALSVLLLAFVGASNVSSPRQLDPLLFTFTAVEIVITGYLIYQLKEARLPAIALAGLSISYAVFSAFEAAITFIQFGAL